jgi:hypothetical protein
MSDEWGQSAVEDFAMDASEISPSDLGGGDVIDKEGWYHLEVVDVKNEFDLLSDKGKEKSPCVVLTCNVLETVKGQSPAGSKYFHRIYVASKGGGAPAEGAVKSALRFGVGLGLFFVIEKDGREFIVDGSTGSFKIMASTWQRSAGVQFVAKIKLEKSDDPKFPDKYTVPFGRAYDPRDPAVADTPKNKEALKMAGYLDTKWPEPIAKLRGPGYVPGKVKAGTASDAGAEKPPAAKQETKATTAASKPADDDLSDL